MIEARWGNQFFVKAFYFVFFYFASFLAFSQSALIPDKGVPSLHNFTPADYLNSGKIWDISSGPSGLTYMAADKGLLEFDGEQWHLYKGSTGFTRSLYVANDSIIYSGSDLDFGVWTRTSGGALSYTSLYPFKDVARNENEEFWNVEVLDGNVIFISHQNLYVFKDEQLTKIGSPERIQSSFLLDGRLYLADVKGGIYELLDYDLQFAGSLPVSENPEILGSYVHNDSIIWITRSQGLFLEKGGIPVLIKNPLSELLQQAKVFSVELIDEEYIAFGTVLKGLIIADLAGNIRHQINRFKGLPGNTVLKVYKGPYGKLWLSLEYGLTRINLNDPLSSFFDYTGQFGSGYTATLWEGKFYLGTNQGLFQADWEALNNNREDYQFSLIPGSEGQVWELKVINDAVLVGHDRGLLELRDSNLVSLRNQEGVWTLLEAGDYLLTGTYNGVGVYQKRNDQWEFLHKMDLILGSCSQLLLSPDQSLWVNIPNYGVLKVKTDASMQAIDRIIFPDSIFKGEQPVLSQVGDSLLLSTSEKRYWYASQSEEFEELGTSVPAVYPMEGGVTRKLQKVNGSYWFIPRYNGFSLLVESKKENTSRIYPPLLIRSIEAFHNKDTMAVTQGDKIPFAYRNIKVRYIVPHEEGVLYRYRQEGEEEWSNWSSHAGFEVLLLPHGSHNYQVQAAVNNNVIAEGEFSFSIATPWYASWYALVLYAFSFVALVVLLRYRYWKSLAKQKAILLKKEEESLARQAQLYQRQLAELEQQRLQEQFEDIKQQLKNKTVELAVKAREAEEKNKLIESLREHFEKAKKSTSVASIKWAEMDRILKAYMNGEDKTFEIQMDELHQEFFKKLKEQFPNLSSNDLRLCAYLKIGLNSKEIADLLNIQPSSSYISRSRLRKKLKLKAEDDLFDFLNSF
jgi:DNA-binding CsgD family transcriptional regulator